MPTSLTPQAQQLLGLMSAGSYSTARDVIKHQVWDTWLLPAAIAGHTFFSQPVGAAFGAGVKALGETNMYSSGKLPNGQVFVAQALSVQLATAQGVAGAVGSTLIEGFYTIMDSSVFEIKLQGREWDFQIHANQLLPAVKGQTLSGATNIIGRNGDFIGTGRAKLAPTPIVIDNMIGFQVDMICANPIAATIAKVTAAFAALDAVDATLKVTREGVLSRAK